jgi:ferredoxin
MPKLTVENVGQFDVADGKRLVKALTEDAGTDQLHACGGAARCTTCRVQFVEGEPAEITHAEKELLAARNIDTPGIRLSCQIVCSHDMSVKLISRLEGSGRKDQGGAVAEKIEPAPLWTTRE